MLQFLTPVMHFQWEDLNTAVMRPVDWLWQLRAITMCLGSGYMQKLQIAVTPSFVCKMKMGISAGSMGICLAKCLTHNISAIMQDRVLV